MVRYEMTVLVLMIPMSLILGAGFLWAFLKGFDSGQFEDVETPALRILEDDNLVKNEVSNERKRK
jgi:cbb3-type cytochrome oxidase maturation protein